MLGSPPPPRYARRTLLKAAASGLAAMTIATPLGHLSPRAAHAAQTPLQNLTESEATTLEAFAETLCPGATDAGVSRYVDAQFSSQHPLLILRMLDYNGDLLEFYQGSLKALDAYANDQYESAFSGLAADQQAAVAGDLLGGNPDGWQGPPPFLVYFAMRNDAIDVTLGTPEGFQSLDIPYMAHIQPPKGWS